MDEQEGPMQKAVAKITRLKIEANERRRRLNEQCARIASVWEPDLGRLIEQANRLLTPHGLKVEKQDIQSPDGNGPDGFKVTLFPVEWIKVGTSSPYPWLIIAVEEADKVQLRCANLDINKDIPWSDEPPEAIEQVLADYVLKAWSSRH